MSEITDVHAKQVLFFQSNATKDVQFRIEMLHLFKDVIKDNEKMLCEAIYEDFNKSEYETMLTEFSLIYMEIDHFIKNIKSWSKPQKVRTGLANMPASSYMIPEPYGNALVIGTWNYPYQLSLLPAVTAIAAGNTVIIRPSDLAPKTSAAMETIFNEHFPQHFLKVFSGGRAVITELLELPFNKIFYTGSKKVGQIVYEAASKFLTPVTLELGGKSPTFVLKDADIAISAKRIVWGKCLNAGQTCVAPDYVLVDKEIKEPLVKAMIEEMKKYPQKVEDLDPTYMKIINTRSYDRIVGLIDENKVRCHGENNRDERFIAPILMDNVSWDDAVMQEEIFGPILPVITMDDLQKSIDEVKRHDRPLACYIFSRNSYAIHRIQNEISFGGGCVNHCILHLSNINLPFGGVGGSGLGQYHGKKGFDEFSHYKSILHKGYSFEPDIIYPPYTTKKRSLIERFSKR